MDQKTKVITCGCRFNRYESAEIEERLGSETDRDIVIINSCAVTSKSEAKSRHAVRRAVRENPDAAIVVSGCWAEIDPEAVIGIEGVDLVLGNEEKFHIPDYLDGGSETHVGGVNKADKFLETDAGRMENRTAAYLKIQNGCDEVCSFCVVRIARGKSRSASRSFITRQAAELAGKGAREIVLTGINIGQYGRDLDGETGLASILAEIAKRKDVRFRLSSINPREITDELIDVIAENENICRHLHIPLQSGSDRVLGRMRRPYSASEYRDTVERVASRIEGIGIGCDVMAGFPGETFNDFEESAAMLGELPFTYAHVFPYSERAQTESFNMEEAVPHPVRKERVAKLKEISAEKNLAFRQSLVGRKVEVLVEEQEGRLLRGKSGNFVNVVLEGDSSLKGSLCEVVVESLTETGVMGKGRH
jgi:threonylcarbamoyladenosine tRNA methylthiotransferase MtaB